MLALRLRNPAVTSLLASELLRPLDSPWRRTLQDLGLGFRGVTTNTQTRRLGYLSAATKLMSLDPIPLERLAVQLVEWNTDNRRALEAYDSQKGVAESLSAARRYLELAKGFGMATALGSGLQLSDDGLLLKTLLPKETSFALTVAEKLFYLGQLLAYDADTLLALAAWLSRETDPPTLSFLQRGFQGAFLDWLRPRARSTTNESAQRSLSDRVKKIEGWKKPEKYAEHVVAPRLHWLLDLGLLDVAAFHNATFVLTRPARTFFEALTETNSVPDPDWILGDLVPAASFLDSQAVVRPPSDDELAEQLRQSLSALRVGVIPRVKFDIAIRHVSLRLAADEHIYASGDSVVSRLDASSELAEAIGVRIHRSARARESYILLE